LKWRFKTGDWIKGPPSIASDGTIYIGSWDDYLYALYPNGTMKWKCKVGTGTETNPSIANDGTIYVGSYDGHLYAVYPNGTMKWSFSVIGNIHMSSPAISADGTIYFGTDDSGYIYAVNPNGTEKWRKKIAQKWVESSPSIAEDGTVYIGSSYSMDAGYLYAFGRGPLLVDAGGPYSGYVDEEIQFTGTVFGGIPPYEYHWDFGDGNTSDEQNPKHSYSQVGIYTATFNVTDDEGNFSSDNATVTIEEPPPIPPEVKITKPEKGLYIADKKIRSFLLQRKPLIFGSITIEVEASQDEYGISRVEFYIDNEIKYTDDTEPYSWTWDTLAFFKHTIKVVAVDNTENSANIEITVIKFF
jgi:PKD repeat protein